MGVWAKWKAGLAAGRGARRHFLGERLRARLGAPPARGVATLMSVNRGMLYLLRNLACSADASGAGGGLRSGGFVVTEVGRAHR